MLLKSLSAHLAIGLLAGFGLVMTEGSPAFAQASPPPAATGAAAAPAAGPAKPAAKPADASAAKPADASATAKPAPAAKPPTKKQRDAARKAYGEGEKAFAAG